MTSAIDKVCALVVKPEAGVHWAALVDEEGELVGHWPPTRKEDAAIAGAVLRVALRPEIARNCSRASFSTDSHAWTSFPLKDDYLLVLGCDEEAEPAMTELFTALFLESGLSPASWIELQK